jgi:hypothetical protein
MSPANSVSGETLQPGVEELIRYGVHRFNARGIRFPAARMAKLIRRNIAAHGADAAKHVIDAYVAQDRGTARSWAGFELFVNGYADPTGAHAARNVDLARAQAVGHE